MAEKKINQHNFFSLFCQCQSSSRNATTRLPSMTRLPVCKPSQVPLWNINTRGCTSPSKHAHSGEQELWTWRELQKMKYTWKSCREYIWSGVYLTHLVRSVLKPHCCNNFVQFLYVSIVYNLKMAKTLIFLSAIYKSRYHTCEIASPRKCVFYLGNVSSFKTNKQKKISLKPLTSCWFESSIVAAYIYGDLHTCSNGGR